MAQSVKVFLALVLVSAGFAVSPPALAGPLSAPPGMTLPALPGLEGPLIRVQEGCGTECEEEEEYIDEGDRKDDARPPMGLSTVNTNAIAAVLRQVGTTCATEILPEYRIDCIRIHYLAVAAALPDNGDYAPVKAALLDGAAKLDAIVKANLDPVAPPVRAHKGGKPAAPQTPPLRAVKPEKRAEAEAQAAAVVEETSLVILRSGEDPSRREPHYQEISEAVDSGLVILRSA